MTSGTPDAATTVRLLVDAFLAGDVDTFMSYVDDDIEWNPALHHPFLTQQYRGREEFLNGAVATVAATLDEIGKVYGVTRERIRQIESKTMSKLRHTSRSDLLRDYLD